MLLRDFRRGQQLESLVDLAQLELAQGLAGTAALHFARVMSLDAVRLDDDQEVCALFRARARAHLAADEPIAADQDLRRVFETCGVPSGSGARAADLELARAIRPAAEARARETRALAPVRQAAVFTPSGASSHALAQADFDRRLEDAWAEGPRAYADWCRSERLSMVPARWVAVLLDEFDAPTRRGLYRGEDLRVWMGQGDADFFDRVEAELSGQDPARRAWMELRVGHLDPRPDRRPWSEDPVNEALHHAGETSLSREVAFERAWKVFAIQGDFDTAELMLADGMQAMLPAPAPARGPAPEPGEAGSEGPPPPAGPWWARVELADAKNRARLLTLARLRDARGDALGALRIVWTVARASPSDERLALAREFLAAGRPHSARLMVREADAQLAEAVRQTVASHLELAELVCGAQGACNFDEDAARVRAVAGEGSRAESTALRTALPARAASDPARVRCRIGPWFSAEGEGAAWVEAWAEGKSLGTPQLADEWLLRIESEPTSSCGVMPWLELLHAGAWKLHLEGLRSRMIHATIERSSRSLEFHAALALATGYGEDALRNTHAAAAESADPHALWLRAASRGYAMGSRDYEWSGRSFARALAPPETHAAIELDLMRAYALDAINDPLLREGNRASVEAWDGQFERWSSARPQPARAAAVDRLRAELVWTLEDLGLEPDARARELWARWFGAAQLEAAPPSVDVWVAASRFGFEEARPELVGLAALSTGDLRSRVRAARELLAPLRGATRRRVLERLERGAAALPPGAPVASAAFPDPDLVFRLGFDLPIDPALTREN